MSICYFLGLLFALWYTENQQPKIIPFYYGQSVTLQGVVTDSYHRWSSDRVVIDVNKFNTITVSSPSYERVSVTLSPGTRLSIGDIITAYGDLSSPDNFITDTGTEFNYRQYLATDHIHANMHMPSISVTGRDRGVYISLERQLFSVRSSVRDHIRSLFPLPVSALYGGIMIGDQSLFPPELIDVFRKAGLIHIMVLSGSNIALVAGFVYIFSRRYGFYKRYIITGIVTILFVMMTGFTPPSVRALIMILVGYISQLLFRSKTSVYVFMLTILVMLCIEPLLVQNISFILSILATAAIVFVAPEIKNRLTGVTEKLGIREILAQTFATQIIVVPYTMVTMGMVSLIGIFLNIIVLPIIGIMTIGGYVIVCVSYISQFIANILSVPFSYMGLYVIRISEIGVNIPGGFVYSSGIITAVLAGYYLTFLFIFRKYTKTD